MIRRRLTAGETDALSGTPDAGVTLTDVVGTLTDLDDDAVTVSTRRGLVRVQRRGIVAAKEIPPTPGRRGQPHRAIAVSALEELMVGGWAPTTSQWLGRWLLRAAGGYTGRANSCLVLGEPDRPFGDALEAVRAWYATHAAPPLIHLPLPPGGEAPSDPFVTQAAAHGWQWYQHTRVMTAATNDLLAATRPLPSSVIVQENTTLDDAWWALADQRMLDDPTSARAVLTGSPEQVFVTLSRDDEPVARGRIAVAQGWGGVFAVMTREDVRGHGLGAAVMRVCAEAAARRNLDSLYLQVSSDNDAAVRLYEKLGFTTHHDYVYLRPRT